LLSDDTNSNPLIGAEGERVAKQFLKKKGWMVVAQNIKVGCFEIDLIMRIPKTNTVVFVEVRSTSRAEGNPELTLSKRKRSAIKRSTLALRGRVIRQNCKLRVDLVTVRLHSIPPDIRHFEGIMKAH